MAQMGMNGAATGTGGARGVRPGRQAQAQPGPSALGWSAVRLRPARPRVIAAMLVALTLLPGRTLAVDIPYKLVPFTKLALKVVQFLPETGDYKSWDVIGGPLTVAADGTISIPTLGSIAATGLTADQLGAQVAKRLQDKLGLVDLPDASVEIVEYPPIYLIGAVTTPGEYRYRPDMTVLEAVALAGGQFRSTEVSNSSESIKLQASLQGSVGDILRARASIARLQAELKGADTIAFPPELAKSGSPLAQAIMDQETVVFGARRDEFERQNAGLNDLVALYKAEIDVLDQKAQAVDDQIATTQKQLDGVTSLVKSGVSTVSRQTDLERSLAGLRADRLDNTIATMSARQGLSETQRNIAKLQDDRRSSASVDLQTAQASLDRLMLDRETSMRMLGWESQQAAARAAQKKAAQSGLVYTILRQQGAQPVTITADETTPLEPGDVLKVALAPLGGITNAAASADVAIGQP